MSDRSSVVSGRKTKKTRKQENKVQQKNEKKDPEWPKGKS
jgi:hypothetical protein